VINRKSPVFGRGFSYSFYSLADGVKLLRNGEVVCFHDFELISDLTSDFWGNFEIYLINRLFYGVYRGFSAAKFSLPCLLRPEWQRFFDDLVASASLL
jgi:hypothetical protein